MLRQLSLSYRHAHPSVNDFVSKWVNVHILIEDIQYLQFICTLTINIKITDVNTELDSLKGN